jgi:hypothetical protein
MVFINNPFIRRSPLSQYFWLSIFCNFQSFRILFISFERYNIRLVIVNDYFCLLFFKVTKSLAATDKAFNSFINNPFIRRSPLSQ